MKIEILKIYKNKEKTDIDIMFIDDDKKEIAGHCNYSITENNGNNEGLIYDTYLYPEYRRKKIMTTYINDILCDMKCMGANKVKLNASSNEACMVWEKFGFIRIDKKGNMEIDLSNKICKCLSTLHSFTNETNINKLIENTYK